MRYIIYFIIVGLCVSCGNVKKEDYDLYNEDVGSSITYVPYEYDTIFKNWISLPDSNASIECKVIYPRVNDNHFIRLKIDTILRNTLRYWMVDTIMPEWSISEILNQTIISFKKFLKDNDLPLVPYFTYETTINVLRPFDKIWIIIQKHSSYTGGAHGYYYDACYTFIENNLINDISEIIEDTIKFKELQIEYLKKQSKIPASVNLSDAGFFVTDESFYLTNNFFFTADTFYTCYNPYDIACFADGIQRIAVPITKIMPLIKKEKKQYFKIKTL